MAAKEDRVQGAQAELTAAFIESLEQGIANPSGWVAPWHSGLLSGAVNAVTKRRYTGGNVFLLMLTGRTGPWATYKQWESIGAQVRKGEHGRTILVPRTGKAIESKNGQDEIRVWTYFRTASVFAADQVEGYEPPALPETAGESVPAADAFFAAMESVATIEYGYEGRAYYAPGADRVSLPSRDAFRTVTGFYSTLGHELVHWTGHASRLDRVGITGGHSFGSPEYAREELIAEFGSAFLGASLGVATELRDDHRDYLASWIRVLKDDPRAAWLAAAAASKATAHLLDLAAGVSVDAGEGVTVGG